MNKSSARQLAVVLSLVTGTCLGLGCSPPEKIDTRSPDPVTGQKAVPSAGQVSLSWRRAADLDADVTMVVRYTGAPDGKPEKDKSYAEGAALGSGVVLYKGNKVVFVDTQVPAGCVALTYQFFSVDTSGNWSVGVDAAIEAGAASFPPTGSATEASASRDAAAVTVTWLNPAADAGWSSIEVRRTTGTPATSVKEGLGVYSGTGSMMTEAVSLVGHGEIQYSVFTCNACRVCAAMPLVASLSVAAPHDAGMLNSDGGVACGGGSPSQPCDLRAAVSADGRNVDLNWSSPTVSPDFNRVKVLRTRDAAPTGPDDVNATVVFDGLAATANDWVAALIPTVPASTCVGVSFPGQQVIYHYAVYGCLNAACETVGSKVSFALQLSQALRAGGYVLSWRHATANVCNDKLELGTASMTTTPDWWKSCESDCSVATARQADGVNSSSETSTIRDQFTQKQIAVSRVISSEYCRCVETAHGFGFGPAIEQSPDLTYFVHDEAQRCAKTFVLLNQPPVGGTNTALIGHAAFPTTCAPLDGLAWSEAAVFKPTDAGMPLYITRVPWNGWTCLP